MSATDTTGAPTRTSRQACWDARDAFFSCLDKRGILAAEQAEKEGVCKDERGMYERNCAKSWVDYFNKRRVLEERQRRTLAQAEQQQQQQRGHS